MKGDTGCHFRCAIEIPDTFVFNTLFKGKASGRNPFPGYTGEVITILSSSLAVSVAIGLGAFGFKTHRREIRERRTAVLFRAQEANENVAKNVAEIEQKKKDKLTLNDLKSVDSKTLSDTEQSIGIDDSTDLSASEEIPLSETG